MAASTACLFITAGVSHYIVNEEALTAYCQVVNHMLEIYGAEDIIADTDITISRPVESSNMWLFDFANELC